MTNKIEATQAALDAAVIKFEEALSEAEAIVDASGGKLSFGIEPAYGMGGIYTYLTKEDVEERNQWGYSEYQEGGNWLASSQSC